MEPLKVVYHIDADADSVASWAASVLLEQTVETPRTVAGRYPFVRDHMMGAVEVIDPDPAGGFRVQMALPTVTAAVDPAQFLNVLFGNASLHEHVRLLDFSLPPSLAATFSGPRFGIAGIRARFGVAERPLTASALKPVGIPLDEVVRLCRVFAEGGIDLIKDDHYLADHPFCPFEDRVRRCQAAVEAVAARTGHRAVYAPNLSGTPDAVFRQLDVAHAAGVGAVMVSPMLLGLPFFFALTRRAEVPVIAHPSFGGAARIRPATLFGKLLRLYGADAVIFVNYGGRFSYEKAVCLSVAETMRAPWGPFRPALPMPAGGMQVERTAEILDAFGPDTMLLIGGSLLEAGDALLERTRAFTTAVREAAPRAPMTGTLGQ